MRGMERIRSGYCALRRVLCTSCAAEKVSVWYEAVSFQCVFKTLQAKSCAGRAASRPCGKPEYIPRKCPRTAERQTDPVIRNIQNRCTLHPCGDEKYSGFPACVFCLDTDVFVSLIS